MNVWDWKYRVFFDDKIKEKLLEWMQSLSSDERTVYEEIKSFYCSFFSFGILWDLISEDTQNSDKYVLKAMKNRELIIKTPKQLVRYYRNCIKNSIYDERLKANLSELLEKSVNANEISSEYWSFIARIYGKSFDDMKVSFSSDFFCNNHISLPRQKIIKGNCKEIFEEIYSSITNDSSIQEKFGKPSILDFHTRIEEGNGYGEWWDCEISPTGKNELVLYTNDNRVKSEDYRYTIIHETYPGHGHFYNFIRSENDAMDHGAMGLIEGWATYCEWNTYPSTYVNAVRHNAMACLWESAHLSADELAESIFVRNKRKKRPFKKYVTNLVYSTQYVGFMESYYLGALWLELIFKSGKYTPLSFLQMLASSSKGEFFRLWQ